MNGVRMMMKSTPALCACCASFTASYGFWWWQPAISGMRPLATSTLISTTRMRSSLVIAQNSPTLPMQ
jgi:hypothetical protein